MPIPNKERLMLPFEYKSTDSSSKWTQSFIKIPLKEILQSEERLKDFGTLSMDARMASIFNAYTYCLNKDMAAKAAELAGGVFYFLTAKDDLKENIKSAETFYENVMIYGYRDMWYKIVMSAHEASVVNKNDTGVKILEKIRTRGISNLKEKFELIFLEQMEKDKIAFGKSKRVVASPGWYTTIIDMIKALAIVGAAYLLFRFTLK